MTAEEFLQRARQEIKDDPKDRLTPLTQMYLNRPDSIVDIHVHIFDKRCLSISYILLRLVKRLALGSLGFESTEIDEMELLVKSEEEVYEDIEERAKDTEEVWEDTDEDWELLEKEIEETIEIQEDYELFGFNVKDAIKVLRKKNMKDILEFYHDECSIVNLNEFQDKNMVTGILQMDLETGWGFSPRRKFKKQIDDLKKISKSRPILPYIAVDPRRADMTGADHNLYELFLDAFTDPDTPFFGVKCYPSLGYDPADIRLDPIFEICAAKNIPVLTHCGGESVSTYDKEIRVKTPNGFDNRTIKGDNRKERARELNEPKHWKPVLEKHNNLKLNLGHFGGGTSWSNYGKDGTDERMETIFEMMRNPNWKVYADFSYGLVEEDIYKYQRDLLDSDPVIAGKVLFGTDYWVVLPAGDLLDAQEEFLAAFPNHKQAMLHDNPLKYIFD